ncbi:family 43 glycosylhydrolase [Gilvimarinus sp. SDUM040013]|uniref:Family 43 glycosylhydrolase n=1 Tax=Gilvimarinus gilvus TaxID=3058038 RepID=A0ABU4RXQ8_9GAMM|nr:family 43 glycosylhydrolase [Gilvimarinus sp. SDUM040013]MDO3387247.1 family 43 glycosylhydrolase [Gilvimarinus sp. SDUM040013]MDX6848936.1 family 43 glycosylhydrolase [Gilvimarinus sp. SDUM040013]
MNRILTLLAVIAASFCIVTTASAGESGAVDYDNPIVELRADPWIHRHTDGYYYFIGTVPEFNRLVLRRARTINGLSDAEEVTIWQPTKQSSIGINIWAPELHYFDDQWVIYFAGAPVDEPWMIRMHAITSTAANPLAGTWSKPVRMHTPWDDFSLDATSFAHDGKRYLVWAQKDPAKKYNSALYMAELESPVKIKEPVIMLTEPTLDWEIITYKVNEGAAVFKKNGRIFMTYSASATDHNYAMGMLWADADADLMKQESWHKLPEPVFYTNEAVKRFGPGHNSFTVAEDGETDLLIYHSRDYKELQGTPLTDPNRDARARVLHWDEQGFPVFGQELGD